MDEKLIDISVNFTKTYKEHYNDDIGIREAHVFNTLYPDALLPLRESDTFAGRIGYWHGEYLPVDCNPQKLAQIGYAINIPTLRKLQAEYPQRSDEIEDIIAYWKEESTFIKIRKNAPKVAYDYAYPYGTKSYNAEGYLPAGEIIRKLGAGIASGSNDTRTAGIMLDYGKLMRLGVEGLRNKVNKAAAKNPEGELFYKAADMELDMVQNCIEHYRLQANALSKTAKTNAARESLAECERILTKLKTERPETLREAMQLFVIFVILTRAENYGRMDTYFGDFLHNDLKAGRLTDEAAVQMTMALWDVLKENGEQFDTRVIIGGLGRKNEAAADEFALVAMEAGRRRHSPMPVITMRYYKGQNEELMKKAIDCISEGCIYPVLYNDDVLVEGYMKSMNATYEDALCYAPLGCGEMTFEKCAVGSPNSTMRFAKILEITLRNGRDGSDGLMMGIETGELCEFTDYEKLENAFFKQIRARFEKDIKLHESNKATAAKEVVFALHSILLDDCIERGKGYLQGGIRYFGANVEGFGITNAVNSLAAIKKAVYEDKLYTLEELVGFLDADFVGFEKEQKVLRGMPKYGNNDPYVDKLKLRVEKYINGLAAELCRDSIFSYYTVANVNPGGITLGPQTASSADGKLKGVSLALGNSPDPGTDVSGLTSMLLSAAKSSDPCNGGYVVNMNISKETIQHNKDEIRALFETYFEVGGQQLNVNCFSRGDLEKALKEPEKYTNLIVRVSGYSARFIDLNEPTKKQIIERTLF